MRTTIVPLSLFVLLLGLMLACASRVPATVTVRPCVSIEKDSSIFVLAHVQHERIVKSLADAGINVTNEWARDGYSLTVSVGSRRASSYCGTVNNITYALNGAGQQLMVIKGRGGTGNCEPNVFDDMSRTLASYALRD